MAGELILRPHALSDRDQVTTSFDEGITLQEIADLVWSRDIQEFVVLSINGDIVPMRHWSRVRPKETAIVRGVLVLHGSGGGGKNILKIVAVIAVSVFAAWAAPGVAGALGVTSGLGVAAVGAGITVLGNMAINALFKPAATEVGGANTSAKASSVYSISGQSNQSTPYGVIPVHFGRNKMFPRLAAVPYVENVGSEQFLYMLLDFGYGVIDVQQLQIGDTALAQYKGVTYYVHQGWQAGWPLYLYSSDVEYQQVAVTLVPQVQHIRTTPPGTIRIVLDFYFPRGLVTYRANDGAKVTCNAAVVIYLSPAGQNNWTAFNLFPGRITTDAGRADYGFTETAGGVSTFYSQDKLANGRYGLPKGWNYLTLKSGAKPKVGDVIIMPNGDRYGIAWFNGGNLYQLTSPATMDYEFSVTSGSIALEWRTVDGSAAGTGVLAVAAATNDAFQASVLIQVPEGAWDVRVYRNHPYPASNVTQFDEVVWTAMTSAANRPPISPVKQHTIMELRIQASDQLSGVIQSLNAVCQGRQWGTDGVSLFHTWDNNPAWSFLTVLFGEGNPRGTDPATVDLQSIAAWANYCAAWPANAAEPRFRFDHICDYDTTVQGLLEVIAASGRATLTKKDGKLGVIIDEEKFTPVQMFTPRNSWGFSSTRDYLDNPHALRVKFIDPASDWNQGTQIVYMDGYSAANATLFEDIELTGVTRASQAWRDGRYFMAQGMLRRENFTIETDIENLVCLRGDLVWIQHDVLKVGGESSRVLSMPDEYTLIQADLLPTLPAGSYGVRIRRSDGVFIGPIAATPAGPRMWTLASSASGVYKEDLVVWGYLSRETGEYLVKNIVPNPNLHATLELVEIARAVYTADTGAIPPYVPPANGRPGAVAPLPPVNLQVVQQNYTVNRRPVADVWLQWVNPASGNYAKTAIYSSVAQTQLVAVGESTSNRFRLAQQVDLIDSRYVNEVLEFAAQSVDNTGARSTLAFVTENVTNPRYVPDGLPYFSSNVQNEKTTLTWRDPVNASLPGNMQIGWYDIRWSPDFNSTFERASRVSELITAGTFTTTVPTRNGVYLIKPITTSGVYSSAAAKTVIIAEDVNRKDYFEHIRFAPDWDGQFIDCELDGADQLRLSKDPVTGAYYGRGYWIRKASYDFGQLLLCRVGSWMQCYGVRDQELLSSAWFTPLANAVPIGTVGEDEFDAKVWVAGSDRLSTVIADWTPLETAIPLAGTSIDLTEDSWPIISGELLVQQLYFIVELRSFKSGVTPVVSQAGVDIDFPERLENHPDMPVPATGLNLVFTYPFVFPPSIGITLQNAQPGDYVERGISDQYGVNIYVRNSAGTAIAGVVDIQIWGVGRLG